MICIQVQYVITHEQERLKGQIFRHLTAQLLPDLYTYIFTVEHANLATMHSNGSLRLRNFKIYTKGINSQMSKLLCLQKIYTHIHSSLS